MSGLAKVARILGAEVYRIGPVAARPRGRERPARRRSRLLQRDPAGQPGAHHRRARAAPRRPARRAHAAQADDRRLRHAREDHHDVDARARPARPELPGRRRGPLHRHERGLEPDGEWLIVEADESDRSLLKLHPTIAVVTNAELDHHTEYASSRDVDDTFREFLARARDAVVAPDLTRLRADAHVFGEYDGPAPGAGRAQPPQRGGRPQSHRARRGRRAGGGGPPRHVRRRRPALRDRRHGQRRDGRRRLRPPPDRGPRHDRGRPHAGRRPGHRALPAAPVQPHAAGGEGVRRTRSRRPTWSCCSTCTPPASARRTTPAITGLLIAQHTADARRGVPVIWAKTHATARDFLQGTLQEGDLLLTMGAGDVNTIGRDLVAHSEPTGR